MKWPKKLPKVIEILIKALTICNGLLLEIISGVLMDLLSFLTESDAGSKFGNNNSSRNSPADQNVGYLLN